jgi:O-antigen ligase
LSVDGFGTYTIFTFGGFMGLALGLILKFKEDRTEGCSTERHVFNTASIFSASYALFGSLIIFALFPVLAYEIDVSNNFNLFNLYNGPISIVIGMGAAVLASFCVSALINGEVIVRDVLHAPIAGGIVVGSASLFITNPVYALVAGFAGGAVQSLIQNII